MTAQTPRTAAVLRLREALDAERATSGGNPMTRASVANFLNGPWLDYIVEPYTTATPDSALREALERARDSRYSDEWIGNSIRAALAAPTPAEPTCGEKLGKGPAACMLARGHSGYHEYVPGRGTKRDPSVPVPNYRQASEADDVRTYRPGDPETPAEPGLGQWRPKYEDGP